MNVNIVLFDEFDMLDAFGAAELFGRDPKHFYVNYYSVKGGIINSSNGLKVWTEYLLPEEVEDILVIPGGKGIREAIAFDTGFLSVLKASILAADRCLLMKEGALLAAQTGALYRRKIADFDKVGKWKDVFMAGASVIPNAKIVTDGKFYSCQNASCSLQMTLDVIAEVTDFAVAEKIASLIGFLWELENDGFYSI